MPLLAPLRPVLDTILPPRCPACGAMVSDDRQFCAACWTQLRFIAEPMCRCCGRPFESSRDADLLCAPCMAAPPDYDRLRAAVVYDDLSRSVVLRFKHGGKIGMAPLIAQLLRRHLPDDRANLLLVPVPLHRWRIWRRGFNQSALVAKALARSEGLALEVDMLRRVKATPPLKGYSPRQRRALVSGAFALNPQRRGLLQGRHVVLIDDVHTSGATANACSRLLRRGGAAEVSVLCWARVLREAEEGQ